MKMMRIMGLAVLMVVALLALCPSQSWAGEYFERNGLAIEGYDPVAYFTEKKAVKGSPALSYEYEGSIFYFATAAHREAFASNPGKFSPQYGGYFAYGMAKGYKAAIDPVAFMVVGGKLYLNYSDTVRAQWMTDIPGYVRKADLNWPDVKEVGRTYEQTE